MAERARAIAAILLAIAGPIGLWKRHRRRSSTRIVLVGTDSAEIRETVQTPSINGNPPLNAIQLGYYSAARTNSSLGLGNGTTLIFQRHQFGIAVDSATLSASQLTLRHHVQPRGAIELRVYVSP